MKQFAAESYPLKPNHRFYDPLVRQQELFTQIFTCLHLLARNDADALNAFRWLSQGHCGLYMLNYVGSVDARWIDGRMVCDWQYEANADRKQTAAEARHLLGWLTREKSVDKSDMDDFNIDP